MTFSEKLVRLRKIKGITQDEFASAVGVSRQAVYKWESGQSYPEVPKLLEMKALFGISIDDLLDDSFEIELPEKKRRRKATQKSEENETVKEEQKTVLTQNVEGQRANEEQVTPSPDISYEVKEENEAPAEQKSETPSSVEDNVEEEKKKGFFKRLFGRK